MQMAHYKLTIIIIIIIIIIIVIIKFQQTSHGSSSWGLMAASENGFATLLHCPCCCSRC